MTVEVIYAALTGARRPELIFDQLYAGSPVRCDAEGEVVLPLEAARRAASQEYDQQAY